MPTTAVVIVNPHEDLTETKSSNISDLRSRAIENGESLFYMLPYGEKLPDILQEDDPASILRYDPESENPYRQARVDEQTTGRDIENVQVFSRGAEDISEKENSRGRSAFAGPPDHSNAPPWAGPPSDKGNGNSGKGGGPPSDKGNGNSGKGNGK